MARLRGPRLSLGLGGFHLAGPRVYFGGRRRRYTRTSHTRVTVTVTSTTPVVFAPVVERPAGWHQVTRVEFIGHGDTSELLVDRDGKRDRMQFDCSVVRLRSIVRPWLIGFSAEVVNG